MFDTNNVISITSLIVSTITVFAVLFLTIHQNRKFLKLRAEIQKLETNRQTLLKVRESLTSISTRFDDDLQSLIDSSGMDKSGKIWKTEATKKNVENNMTLMAKTLREIIDLYKNNKFLFKEKQQQLLSDSYKKILTHYHQNDYSECLLAAMEFATEFDVILDGELERISQGG